MELNRFRPYAIGTLEEIFDLQHRHVMIYLARYRFTKTDYYKRELPFALDIGFWQTVLQWTVLLMMIAMGLRLVPLFECFMDACRVVMRIRRYEVFIWTEIIGFMGVEKFWYDAFMPIARYRSGMLEVAFEMGEHLHEELTRDEQADIIRAFVRISTVAGLFYKASAVGMIPLILQLCLYAILGLIHSQLNAIQTLLILVFTFAIHLQAVVTLGVNFMILPHIFIVLKVFRLKLSKCVARLQSAYSLKSRPLLAHFAATYLHLHRRIQLYNGSFRGQLLLHDWVFKLSGLFSVIYYIKSAETLNGFSYLIVTIYLTAYSTVQFVISKLAYFPAQNHLCYRCLASFIAQTQRPRGAGHLASSSELRHQLKADSLLHFLGNNRFGFTFGRRYLITRLQLWQALLTNFYLLILFYKKLTFES